jgi:tRNA(Ile)-lysidine synthase TilS/MesJ
MFRELKKSVLIGEGDGWMMDFDAWLEDHSDTLRSFSGKRVFLLYSGGKDSSLCLHFMWKARKHFGFDLEAHAGAYPLHRYTQEEKERLSAFWRVRGVKITWYDMGVSDDPMEGAFRPCLICQKVRRDMLNRVLEDTVEYWESLVLVVSFTLWDIVSYSLEQVIAGFSVNPEEGDHLREKRLRETAQRFYPVLKMKEGYTVFRPMLRFNESDIVAEVQKEEIPLLSIPCRYKEFRPKRYLQKYYEQMGLGFDYDRILGFAKNTLGLPEISAYTTLEKRAYLKHFF